MPDAPAAAKRTVLALGYTVELDLTSQVLAVTAPGSPSFHRGEGSAEAQLSARVNAPEAGRLMPASVVAQKAKVFNDGLYAAAEIAAQEGAGRCLGKAALLTALAGALAAADRSLAGEAQDLVLGAARLGQVRLPDLPDAVEVGVGCAARAFLADETRSKPIGFYTWSEQLASIFRQDRMLQAPLTSQSGIEVLVGALRADPSARAAYEAYLMLVSRLTNPLAAPDLRPLLETRDRGKGSTPEPPPHFFPPSVAHETEVIKRLYGNSPIPTGFVLADEMIRRIRSGELDLSPTAASGWYDYQTWAQEPLVVPWRMPEGPRLVLKEDYRELLCELYKGLITLTRETHVKQLEVPWVAIMPLGLNEDSEEYIDIAPELVAEPLPTFYLRRAIGYRFVRGVLEDAFGPGQLERMHRLTEHGPAGTSLEEELADIEALFVGAHVLVSRQLGMAPDEAAGADATADAAATRFGEWAGRLEQDPDLGRDLRAMVPVFVDVARGQTKVWAFLGWTDRDVSVSFARAPVATVLGRDGRPASRPPRIRWRTLGARLAYPVTAEFYVDRLLDRDEFRRLCDACGTRTEILRRLGVAVEPTSPASDHPSRASPRTCSQCGWQPRGGAQAVEVTSCPRCGGVLSGDVRREP